MKHYIDAMTDSKNKESARVEEFIQLLTEHDRSLTTYVMSMVPSNSDAQDIIQETKMALWRSMDSFESGTNFGAWARKTAFHRILDYRKKKGRERERLWFTEKCYELMSDDYEANSGFYEEQSEKLKSCIAKLPQRHREVLVLRYFKESSVEEVAARVNRSLMATYRMLSRIRLALRKCILSNQNPS